MIKKLNRSLLAAAAVSMAMLPVAAQANTRAGDNGSVYSASAPGLGRTTQGESIESGSAIILALLAAGLIIGGIILATQTNDDGQSPGT